MFGPLLARSTILEVQLVLNVLPFPDDGPLQIFSDFLVYLGSSLDEHDPPFENAFAFVQDFLVYMTEESEEEDEEADAEEDDSDEYGSE
ncbi:hypothetical protein F5Y11DRAFT_353628 [Daldinia sp. FL1419]|nr:hypothetical protein F5Y11DRAFT_353628 [Daldinia sp. FL1419]